MNASCSNSLVRNQADDNVHEAVLSLVHRAFILSRVALVLEIRQMTMLYTKQSCDWFIGQVSYLALR